MATLKYELPMDDWEAIGAFYGNDGNFTATNTTTATWFDTDTSFEIEIIGKNLKFENGALVSGTVKKLIFEDFEQLTYATFSGEFNAKKLAALGTDSVSAIVQKLSSGDDRIIGTADNDYLEGFGGKDILLGGAGSDILWGGAGRDRMTGGSGSDYFWFDDKNTTSPGDGHAIVTDFDANGGGVNQDYIAAEAWMVQV